MKYLRYLAALLLLTVTAARAQTPEELPPPAAPVRALPDSARRVNQLPPSVSKGKKQTAADSAKLTERLFGMRFTRPGKAALLAAILPGAGQIYNHSYWKLPLVYAAVGGTLYGEIHYQSRYSEYVNGYNARTDNDPNTQDNGQLSSQERSVDAVQRGIVFYRGYRDIFYLYVGLAYGLQIVDALVDAHLKDFDVSEDLTLHWEPTLLAVPGQASALPTAPGVMFALKIK